MMKMVTVAAVTVVAVMVNEVMVVAEVVVAVAVVAGMVAVVTVAAIRVAPTANHGRRQTRKLANGHRTPYISLSLVHAAHCTPLF